MNKFKESKNYTRWKITISMAKEFPVDEHVEEIKTLHANRLSRSLSTNSINIKGLVKASAQDLHTRSRCVELMAIAKKSMWILDRANESMRDYIFDRDFATGKNQAEKVRSANFLLRHGINYLNRLEYFVDICEDFITDIDKSQFQIKMMFDAISLASRGERQL